MTQVDRVYKALKRAGTHGVTNWQLSRMALKYTSVISDLRAEGCNIMAQRQILKNGRSGNTWRYFLISE